MHSPRVSTRGLATSAQSLHPVRHDKSGKSTQPNHRSGRFPDRLLAANAAGSFTFGNRSVAGMWVIDRGRQQEDVVLIYGRLPEEIQMRHVARKTRMKARPRGRS